MELYSKEKLQKRNLQRIMRNLKSVLVVILLPFCAFQSNAKVLPTVYSAIEVGSIIEWETASRTLSVQVNSPELVKVIIINSNNEVVFQDILTDNPSLHIIDLHHLPTGVYQFIASCDSETVSGTVIIE